MRLNLFTFVYIVSFMNEHLDASSEDLGSEENEFEIKLRPAAFDDFSGQQKVVDNLEVFVSASNQRGML